jgi:hypothetical protein
VRLYNPPKTSTPAFPPVSELLKYGCKTVVESRVVRVKFSVTSLVGVYVMIISTSDGETSLGLIVPYEAIAMI